jgi:hypothetical protein
MLAFALIRNISFMEIDDKGGESVQRYERAFELLSFDMIKGVK